jgi:hypothetical protein
MFLNFGKSLPNFFYITKLKDLKTLLKGKHQIISVWKQFTSVNNNNNVNMASCMSDKDIGNNHNNNNINNNN